MEKVDKSQLLRRPEVAQLLGIGQSTWSRWVAEGRAPRPIRLSSHTVAWRYSDILAFINDRED